MEWRYVQLRASCVSGQVIGCLLVFFFGAYCIIQVSPAKIRGRKYPQRSGFKFVLILQSKFNSGKDCTATLVFPWLLRYIKSASTAFTHLDRFGYWYAFGMLTLVGRVFSHKYW